MKKGKVCHEGCAEKEVSQQQHVVQLRHSVHTHHDASWVQDG